jgi:hypothetical protein
MRAGTVLQALARTHAVTLVTLPIYAAPTADLDAELASCCERVVELSHVRPFPRPEPSPPGGLTAI